MLKKEAAATLGVSERAISRYTAKGKLTVSYRNRPEGGSEAHYDEAQVEALKRAMEAPKKPEAKPEAESRELTRRDRSTELQTILSGLAESLTGARTVSLGDKLTLSLSEAVRLSGLSENFLRQAIRADQLKAVRGRSRGWSIKTSDLRAFVEGL